MTAINVHAASVAKPHMVTFQKLFGRQPQWITRAPGRVNLIGEHTDYNNGLVLPMAIERETTVYAAPNDSNVVNVCTTSLNATASIDLRYPVTRNPKADWLNYLRGVIAGFLNSGRVLRGFDALVHSTVPLGAGLSSSAALEVSFATLLEVIAQEPLSQVDKILLCQAAEHDYVGTPCGLMDQFISTVGRKDHLLLLDCRSRQAQHIEFADSSVSILIINSNVKHQLSSSEYPLRRTQCELAAQQLSVPSLREASAIHLQEARNFLDPVAFRRARHVIGEIARTSQMVERVRHRDWRNAGLLMYESHESLQKDFEVSCPELDAIVASARNIGVDGGLYGCRMTGGGFGGCAVALIEASAESSISRSLSQEYARTAGITPVIFSSRPAQGASIVLAN